MICGAFPQRRSILYDAIIAMDNAVPHLQSDDDVKEALERCAPGCAAAVSFS